MVTSPKPADWVTEVRAEKIICQVTGCDFTAAREPLEAAVREGLVRSRKINQASTTELHAKYWEDKDRAIQARNARERFEFHQGDLLHWLSPADDKPARRRGRPPEHDWEAFWIEAVSRADIDGLPERQADFERQMADWFEHEQGKAPSDSQIREKAGKLYARRR